MVMILFRCISTKSTTHSALAEYQESSHSLTAHRERLHTACKCQSVFPTESFPQLIFPGSLHLYTSSDTYAETRRNKQQQAAVRAKCSASKILPLAVLILPLGQLFVFQLHAKPTNHTGRMVQTCPKALGISTYTGALSSSSLHEWSSPGDYRQRQTWTERAVGTGDPVTARSAAAIQSELGLASSLIIH